MRRALQHPSLAPLLGLALAAAAGGAAADNWPQWRGPSGDNHAAAGVTAPVDLDESTLLWRTPVPGRGHSSPVVYEGLVYLTTAEGDEQSLLVFDRDSGELLRRTVAHRGALPANIHPNNTHASPTVACDGRRVFALFCNGDAAWVTAFDLQGKKLWQKRALGFDPQMFQFGFGSSPRLAAGHVVVASEYDGPESGIVALDPATGDERWRAGRPKSLSYSSPAVATIGGAELLLMSGNQALAANDAATGAELWSTPGSTRATCGTMVWDEAAGLAFASGGFPDTFTCAVRLGGDHSIAWQKPVKCYEQSLLVADGVVFAVADAGVAYAFRASNGEELWRERLGGKYSSSPVLVGDAIFVASESGDVHVFRAAAERFERLGKNRLGTEMFATPTPVSGALLCRYADSSSGERKEFLAAFGAPPR